jgi:hypothetical protein
VLQVVTDRCVDIGKRERWILLKNFFGRGSFIKRAHNGIQADTGSSYTHNSVFVGEQRRWISRNLQGHNSHFITRLMGEHGGHSSTEFWLEIWVKILQKVSKITQKSSKCFERVEVILFSRIMRLQRVSKGTTTTKFRF